MNGYRVGTKCPMPNRTKVYPIGFSDEARNHALGWLDGKAALQSVACMQSRSGPLSLVAAR
jgi:hypothetical protein